MRATVSALNGLCLLIGTLALAACNLAPGVASDAVAYHETADVTANRIILFNVLRARDNAPLHFGELSLQHGQLSEQGGVAFSLPIGQIPHSSSLPRASVAPVATVGDQVNFDLGTLDTQTFSEGVTAPIKPKMLKYFLDSGIDHRLVLMILVAGARIPGGYEAILNFPRSERVVCYMDGVPVSGTTPDRYELRGQDEVHELAANPADCPKREGEFIAFLRILNGLRRVYAVSYRPFTPIGQPFRPDVAHSLHDMLILDPAKHQVRALPDGRVQFGLQAADDKIALCQEAARMSAGGAPPAPRRPMVTNAEASPGEICGDPNATILNTDSDGPSTNLLGSDVTLRSTFGIFSFLGQVLGSQMDRSTPGNDVCIRLDAQAASSRTPACNEGQVLFHLTQTPAAARFGVYYQGQYWGVPDAPPCVNSTRYCDHTLETMSMLSLLLNLNKSARDIPSTPAVQIVP